MPWTWAAGHMEIALNLFNNLGGLPFWTERQIMLREHFIVRLYHAVRSALVGINGAWQFERVEGPTLTPMEHVSPAYDDGDLFMLRAPLAGQPATMRAETTASSYAYARHLIQSGDRRLPLCVWQAGKSYRREQNDGARAASLRFHEFWQCEFQCIFAVSTKADYAGVVIHYVEGEIRKMTGQPTRIVPSDRLPSYSLSTTDVESMWRGYPKEMASISMRTDYDGASVLEVAAGLDRIVLASEQ